MTVGRDSSIALLILLLLAIPSATQATPSFIIVTEELPPLQIVENQKVVAGSAHTKVMEIFKRAGLNTVPQLMPWARAYSLALRQPNVFIYSIVRTDFRENKFHWIKLLDSMDTHLVGLASRDIKLTALKDVKNYVVAVKRKDVMAEFLIRKGFQFDVNLASLNDSQDTVSMVMRNRADLVPFNLPILNGYCELKGCDISQFRSYMTIPELKQNFYLAASLNTDQALLDKIRQTISAPLNAD